MAKLIGKWKHESSKNMKEFLEQIEYMPADKLQTVMDEADKWYLEISKNGDEWTIREEAPSTGSHTTKFKSGVKFTDKDEVGNAGEVESQIDIDGDSKMTQTHFHSLGNIVTVRKLGDGGKMLIDVKGPGLPDASSVYIRR